MGSDAKNLVSDGNVQIVKTGEVIGAMQLTEGESIVEADGRVKNTVVTGADQLKVAAGGIAKCARYGSSGTLSVNDGAIATDIAQPEGGAISLSTLAVADDRHPEGEFSADKDYACGLLLENGDNLRVPEGHCAEKIILDREGGLLVNRATSAVVVNEGGELSMYSDGEASNCKINQGGVFILVGKASSTLFVGGTVSNLSSEDSDIVAENGVIYRLGADGLQFYNSGKTQNLSVNVGGRAEVRADTLENAVIQDGTVILLPPTSADENPVIEEDRTPVELADSVVPLDGASMIISYSADLQQLAITVRQGGVLTLGGNTVKGDDVIPSVGNINLDGGRLWLIIDAATQVHPKVKHLCGEGMICLQTSAKEISSDFISVKGEATGDIHVEITDASRQTLCNALKLQPDEDGIGTTPWLA